MEPTLQNPDQIPKKKEHFIRELVKFTVIAIAIVVPIRLYIAQPFIVKGESMDNTFADGQYLIVDQLSYHFKEPARGEVIILHYPLNPKTYFIKRIIGLPNETVVSKNGIITIINKDNPEGFVLDEPYIDPSNKASDSFRTTLKDTEYFVMGDNRSHSSDSHIWGPLERKYIAGRPFFRLIPVSIFPGSQNVAK
jgi:signal peptidase I